MFYLNNQTFLDCIIYRIVPVVIILPCIGYIAETCSILIAISELNLEVIRKCYMKFNDSDNSWVLPSDEVLNEVEDTNRIISDLRKKIMTRVAILESVEENKEQVCWFSHAH